MEQWLWADRTTSNRRKPSDSDRDVPSCFDDDDELLVRASAVLKSQGPENWSRGRPDVPSCVMTYPYPPKNITVLVPCTNRHDSP